MFTIKRIRSTIVRSIRTKSCQLKQKQPRNDILKKRVRIPRKISTKLNTVRNYTLSLKLKEDNTDEIQKTLSKYNTKPIYVKPKENTMIKDTHKIWNVTDTQPINRIISEQREPLKLRDSVLTMSVGLGGNKTLDCSKTKEYQPGLYMLLNHQRLPKPIN